jgi:predicted RecA/RadA family phage recombinase
MKNFIQCGDTLTAPAPAGCVSGSAHLIGAMFGIAVYDAEVGEPAEFKTTGVFLLPKTAAEQWVPGDAINWIVATSKVGKGTGLLIGYAADFALNPSDAGAVRLDGGAIV